MIHKIPPLKLADLLDIFAHFFTIQSKKIAIKSQQDETDVSKIIREIFNTPHALKADFTKDSALTPGHYYCLTQDICDKNPNALLLVDATPEQGSKRYAVSALDFINAFASRQLPFDEHDF